jgi:hypothetical protein
MFRCTSFSLPVECFLALILLMSSGAAVADGAAVEQALTEKRHLIVEAGTGLGRLWLIWCR